MRSLRKSVGRIAIVLDGYTLTREELQRVGLDRDLKRRLNVLARRMEDLIRESVRGQSETVVEVPALKIAK